MSTEEEVKKIKGFNKDQVKELQKEIRIALGDEVKVINEGLESRLNEFRLSISNEFKERFDQLHALFTSQIEATKIKDASASNSCSTPSNKCPSPQPNISVDSSGSIHSISGISGINSSPSSYTPITPITVNGGTTNVNMRPEMANNKASHRSSERSSEQPNAAIDSNQKLPSTTWSLPETDVTPEEYRRWSIRITQSLKGLSKYEGIIDKPPDISWTLFQGRNKKYVPCDLESYYLDVHRAVCGYISRGIDPGLAEEIEDQLKVEALTSNLSRELGFDNVDPSFYENAYQYWEKIKARYLLKSAFQITKILDERDSLKYDGKQDPAVYIARHNQLKNRRKLLIPSYPEIPEFLRAIEILHGLPKTSSLDALKTQFYNRENGIETISIKEVEEALRHWWADQQPSMSTSLTRREPQQLSRSRLTVSQPGGSNSESSPRTAFAGAANSTHSLSHRRHRRRSSTRSPSRNYPESTTSDSRNNSESEGEELNQNQSINF